MQSGTGLVGRTDFDISAGIVRRLGVLGQGSYASVTAGKL